MSRPPQLSTWRAKEAWFVWETAKDKSIITETR